MLELKREVVEEIRGLAASGRCSELHELVERIELVYRSIDAYFVTTSNLRAVGDVSPDSLRNVHRCMDSGGLEIEIDGAVNVAAG